MYNGCIITWWCREGWNLMAHTSHPSSLTFDEPSYLFLNLYNILNYLYLTRKLEDRISSLLLHSSFHCCVWTRPFHLFKQQLLLSTPTPSLTHTPISTYDISRFNCNMQCLSASLPSASQAISYIMISIVITNISVFQRSPH